MNNIKNKQNINKRNTSIQRFNYSNIFFEITAVNC